MDTARMVAGERSPEVLTHWKKKSTPICGKISEAMYPDDVEADPLIFYCTKDLGHNGAHAAMVAAT